jgi:translocation and assembly module TamB
MGRFLRYFLPAVISLLLIVVLAGWWTMHTRWFMNLVRTRLIAVVERATGGKVEIGTFSYDTGTITAEAGNFVLHGTEPPSAEPLVRIQRLKIGLKILSFWRRDIDIESLTMDKPEVHLLISPNGTTNIPTPKIHNSSHHPIQQLLDLKIGRLELHNGVFSLNDRRERLDLSSYHFALDLAYNLARSSYDLAIALPATELQFRSLKPPLLNLQAKAHLLENSLQFDSFHITSDHSTIDGSGTLNRFERPNGAFALDAAFAMNDLATLGGLNQLQNGSANVKGDFRFDTAGSDFVFTSQTKVRQVDYVSRRFTLRGIDAEAAIRADKQGVVIKQAIASARGAHFSGEGIIKNYRSLQVQGRVSRVSLQEVATYLTKQPVPWSGMAAGTAFASATLQQPDANFVIGAQVDITPESGAIPTSGIAGVTYTDRSGEVHFSHVKLSLPHSQLSFDGSLSGNLDASVDSSDLADLTPVLPILGATIQPAYMPALAASGHVHFAGAIENLASAPTLQGDLAAFNFKLQGQTITQFDSRLALSASIINLSSFQLSEPIGTLKGSASLGLANWSISESQPMRLSARFSDLDVVKTAALFSTAPLPVINGIASGTLNLAGSLADPAGNANVRIANLDAYGQQINQIAFQTDLAGDLLKVSHGRVQSGPALLNFSGDFRRANNNWSTGDVHLRADTNGFPLASLSTIHKYAPALAAQAEAHFDTSLRISARGIAPLRTDGTASLTHVTIAGIPYGEANIKAVTEGNSLALSYSGKLLQTEWNGKAHAQLVEGTPIEGDLQLARLDFATLKSLLPTIAGGLTINGFLQGGMQFSGPLEKPEQMRGHLTINDLEISSPVRLATVKPGSTEIMLRNKAPILIEAAGGVARVRSFEITGNDTSIALTGEVSLVGRQPLNIKAVGKANLQIFSLFDPNVQSSGASEVAVTIGGSLSAPTLTGALDVTNGSFFLTGIPNGLSAVNGTVVFTRNRATIQKMSATSGGGQLSLTGFVNFAAGTPLVYHLEGQAQNVRVRYANSISVTANSDLRLSGTSTSSILSGSLSVTRVVFTPNADVGNLLAAAGATASASGDQGDFLNGLHLDIAVESAPNLQVSTNLSRDVEAEIQLRLRGTPDHPILLGSITANQGDLRVFGTRYTLNRGEVNFVNTVRAEPVIDLDLETQTRGVTVDITISGTPSKLNFNYRSDPPLQPRDIIALLTVGRAPGVGTTSNAQGGSDISALSSGVNSVLGQAISPVSGRLSRLFGITNIRIDPFVQGITNTPQARLSVEQQISRDVTVTYITNLSQTSEQIFRLEWALNRQFSIVAIRDDNGEFGIDFQYKKRFK